MTAAARTPADQRRPPLPPRLTPLRRLRRVLAVALWLCFIPVAFSYVPTMLGPSNSSFTIRSFEWLRDHGAAQIASEIETVYYTMNAPTRGGAPLRKLSLKADTSIESVHPTAILRV